MVGARRKPVGIGMIGAGMMGQVAHLSNFIQNEDCRVVALAELRPELGRLAAARFGVPKVYGSHRQLLDDAAIDAVVVVTRRPATGPIVLDALNAGKHVLSEKPMAHSVAQAERLAAAAAQRGLCYALGYMRRHDAGTAEAKRLVDAFRRSGELGRIVLMRAYCYGGAFACGTDGFVMTDEPRPEGLELWPIGPDWVPADRLEDYAWFLNVYSHDINLIRYLVGGPLAVTAVDLTRRNGRVVLFDAREFPVALEMAEIGFDQWQEGVEVLFEGGRLSLTFPSPMLHNVPARVSLYRAKQGVAECAVEWSWAFRRQADAFVRDVMEGAEPLASGADALEDLRVAEKIWRCHLRAGGRRPGV